ncbi:MAG: histidine phosphatase family protein [Chloroflexi bacterium]|nr:histidine phosphatase family protein [Chloroflexota bacterium]
MSNANLPTTHPAASELTAKGHREADYVVQAFSAKPDLIVVSPYIRARQTAVPTINHFKPIKVAEWGIEEFSYLHPDKYNGTTGNDRRPAAQAYWNRMDPLENEGGEGESFASLLARVQVMENQLWQASEQFVVLFSHGLFLRAFLWMTLSGICKATPETMERYLSFSRGFSMPNGSILKTQFGENGRIQFSPFDTDHIPSTSP